MLRRLVLLACFLLASALSSSAPSADAAQRGWTYVVTANEDLTRLQVRICFQRFGPKHLTIGDAAALDALRLPPVTKGRPGLQLDERRWGVRPVSVGPNDCVTYDVDVKKLTAHPKLRRRAFHIGKDLVVSPNQILLRPALWPRDVSVTLRVQMPPNLKAAIPWRPVNGAPNTYQLWENCLSKQGQIAFGRFEIDVVNTSGTEIRVAVLDAPHTATREGIRAWLKAAADAVAELFGGFPAKRVTVLVAPTGATRVPVMFGQAMQPGGASVIFYTSQSVTDEKLLGEWVAVHEFIHLGMSWTFDSEVWFQEGFTTYYQEVLRARAGFEPIQGGWQLLHEGFGRGRRTGTGRTLTEESRDMHKTHSYWRVYWAGAVIALQCDLAIRRQTAGVRSLDDAMRHLYRSADRGARPHRGLDLLGEIDAWLGKSICVPIAKKHLQSNDFPDVAATYAALGLQDGKRVAFAPGVSRDSVAYKIMRKGGR